MVTRFTDERLAKGEGEDFIVRRRPLTLQIAVAFAISFVAIYFTAIIMHSLGNQGIFVITLSLVIGSLAWVAIAFAAQHRDLVMVTEFQNALLASAAQINTRFCLITKRDGSIVYIDSGFQKLFPHYLKNDSRTIEKLLANAGTSEEITQKIDAILDKNTNDRVLLSLKDAGGTTMPMMMTIDMLPRPKGYFLFRGRDYVENRNAVATPVETTTSAQLLAQTLYALPEAILIADKAGKITYTNNALEQWLGYSSAEMLAPSFSLPKIFHQYAGKDAGVAFFDNFEGDITLLHKNRSPITLHLRQSLLSDRNEVLGISAVMWKSS